MPLAPPGQLEYSASGVAKSKSGLSPELLDVLGPKATEIVGEEALQTEWYKTIFDQSDGERRSLPVHLPDPELTISRAPLQISSTSSR
jgi:hypothetical protein